MQDMPTSSCNIIRKKTKFHRISSKFKFFVGTSTWWMPDTQSWPFYIGSKRGKLQACPHRPVLHPFPWRWRSMENPLFGLSSDYKLLRWILLSWMQYFHTTCHRQYINLYLTCLYSVKASLFHSCTHRNIIVWLSLGFIGCCWRAPKYNWLFVHTWCRARIYNTNTLSPLTTQTVGIQWLGETSKFAGCSQNSI